VNLYSKIEFDKLLIVDEAHNFLNQINDELDREYKYKLGLSATPVFGSDATKTKRLLDWFGGQVIDLPIEKVLGKYLVNYEYHPIFVNSTSEEEENFKLITSKMRGCFDKSGALKDKDKLVLYHKARLRIISMASEKIDGLSSYINEVNKLDHFIIYCSDGKMYDDYGEELKHIKYVLNLMNNMGFKPSKFTADENMSERMSLINNFNKGYISSLVAIRCLDEGINIPSIESALILSSNDNYREFVQRRGRILRLYSDGKVKKEKANIYDVIVLPSLENKSFIEIELRRFYEYARLALNFEELSIILKQKMSQYGLSDEDIKFNNDFVYGGDLDD
jgi:superfamily II DNA or RNA helicase